MNVSKILLVVLLACTQIVQISQAEITPEKLKRYDVKLMPCPTYIAHLTSGLASSILKSDSICVKKAKFGKAKRLLTPQHLVLDGSDFIGSPFPKIVRQEGDVQTQPFQVKNYPAIISYRVDEVSSKSSFKIAVIDSHTGKEVYSLLRGVGRKFIYFEGKIAINIPGDFYLRITASGEFLKDPENPKDGDEIQPVFTVGVEFMNKYIGESVLASDLKPAGIKTVKCPTHIIDRETGKYYALNKKYICSNNSYTDLEDVGFTTAPLNLGLSLFLATDVSYTGNADHVWLPFRIMGPTPFRYASDDPSDGRGSMNMDLMNLTTGRKASRFVETSGNILDTTTSLNIPGDYYVFVDVNSFRREEFGELSFDYDIVTN